MHDIKSLLRQAARPTLFLLTFIVICAFLARSLNDSETLLDYARENPELAYGTEVGEEEAPVSEMADTPVTPDKPAAYPEKENNDSQETDAMLENTAPEGTNALHENNDSQKTDALDKNTASNETAGEDSHPNRTIYKEGFYYEPLNDTIKKRITGISYPESGCTVPYEDLNYVSLLYVDFDGKTQTGELICNKAVAQDMAEIFYELYQNDYRLERVRLIDEYAGDDTASMADNNTSCFNYRVVDGTTNLSKHAYGLAIDVNPYYNPYVVFGRNSDGSDYISPPGSEIYADRSQNFPYKIDENDLCYRLFTEHGFTWGGNWNSTKDYQHFQKKIH